MPNDIFRGQVRNVIQPDAHSSAPKQTAVKIRRIRVLDTSASDYRIADVWRQMQCAQSSSDALIKQSPVHMGQ